MSESTGNDQLLELLGQEDFDALMEIRERRSVRAKNARIKELATGMVAEGGKYGTQYERLNSQLDAVWNKAQAEATAEVEGAEVSEDEDDEEEEEEEAAE